MVDLLIGQVVNNINEKANGWVQIRIPQIHGINSQDVSFTPDSMLPWAVPCSPYYTMYEAGTFIIPPIGAKLFLVEVNATPSYYVYLGGAYGVSNTPQQYSLSLDKEVDSYSSDPGILAPRDITEMKYGQSGVLFKTPKGHTIKYSDENGAEYFEFVDRSGQSMKFICPVSSDLNRNNGAKRGISGTREGGSIKLTSGGTTITIDTENVVIDTTNVLVHSKGTDVSITPNLISMKSPTVTITTDRATTVF